MSAPFFVSVLVAILSLCWNRARWCRNRSSSVMMVKLRRERFHRENIFERFTLAHRAWEPFFCVMGTSRPHSGPNGLPFVWFVCFVVVTFLRLLRFFAANLLSFHPPVQSARRASAAWRPFARSRGP